MAKLNLTNFRSMNPETPEFSSRNQHYLISGSDPFYYLAQSTVQEQRQAPLAASFQFTQIDTLPAGSYVDAYTQTYFSGSPAYEVVVGNDIGNFYGIKQGNSRTALGSLSKGSDATGQLVPFNGKFWYSTQNSTSLYSRPIDNGAGSWTSTLTLNGSNELARPTAYFGGVLTIADSTGGTGTGKHVLKTVNTGNTFGTSLDIGTGFDIIATAPSTNNYLAIAAGYSGTDIVANSFSAEYYLLLWDGNARGTIRYIIPLPGVPLDIAYILDGFYMVIYERSGQYALYKLLGTTPRRMFPIAIDAPAWGPNGLTGKSLFTLFEYAGMIGINLATKGQYLFSKDGKYILTGQQMDLVVRSGTNLYGFKGTGVYVYGTNYANISYKSQWAPFEDPRTIIVKYATPPQGNGDTIQVTLDGYDEDGTASSSLPLTQITSSNYYNSYKTPLDTQGFQGKFCRVSLTTTSGTGWQPIIREIELVNDD